MVVEKRKTKQKRKQEEVEKPTKAEYAVGKFLRFNVPSKEGKLMGMTVQYFIGSKAVDALMESKWSSTKAKADPLFSSRASCVTYCNTLLQKGLFHRAARVDKKKDRDKKKKKSPAEGDEPLKDKEEKVLKKDKKKKIKEEKKDEKEDKEKIKVDADEEKEKPEEKEEKKEDKIEEKKEDKKEDKKEEEKKKKKEKKLKLEMHNLQEFKDDDEVYVWIYDPVPLKTFLIGLLLVLGAIAVCLFPLWPPEVRLGVYYLSLAAAGFVGFILALCVIRLVLFCFVWLLTFGKHHFWFLPNLTEDVGFFDSFRPLYKHEAVLKEENTTEKCSEDIDKATEKSNEEDSKVKTYKNEPEEDSKDAEEQEGDEEDSGSDLDISQDNGYEIVNPEDVEANGDDDDDDDDDDDNVEEERAEDEIDEEVSTEPKKTR